MRIRIKKLEELNAKLIIIILSLYDANLQKEKQLNFEVKIFNE